MKQNTLEKGFTLVELVVVVAIFGVLFSVVSSTFFNSIKAALKAEAIKEVRQNGDVAMARMVHELKGADYIIACNNNPSIRFRDPFTKQAARFTRSIIGSSTDRIVRQVMEPSLEEPVNLFDHDSVQLVTDASGTLLFNIVCVDLGQPSERIDISFDLEYIPFGRAELIQRSEDRVQMHFQTSVVNRNVD